MSREKSKTPITREKIVELIEAVNEVRDACNDLAGDNSGLRADMQQLIDEYEWPQDLAEDAVAALNDIGDLICSMEVAERESESALKALLDIEGGLPKVSQLLDTCSEEELLQALVRKQAERSTKK